MLIETESNVVASAGLQQTSSFQIATSAHAFRILSSGLYSDKIGAVLREIGCNAMDAHIAAGKQDVPFEVHLPSRLTSKFYIRDFGPGLSPDEIKSLYTTYFSSSKQRSNDFTGAFGLGSKSPFSYTDNFTIVSVKDGVKTTYSAYVDQVGGPSVSMIADEPASDDWPNGMMISLPVKQQDYQEFASKAQKIFSWFRVPPHMVNSEQIKPVEYSVEAEDFAVLKTNHERGVRVVMGNVCYPVPQSEWGNHQWAAAIAPVLRMKIGDVDVAASREQLEFTPKTRNAIGVVMGKVFADLGKGLATQLSQLDTSTWAGMKAANQWIGQNTERWAYCFKQILAAGGMDPALIDTLDSLRGRYVSASIGGFVGNVTVRRLNNRGRLQAVQHTYAVSAFSNQRIPVHLHENAAIVVLGKTKYLNDRVREALRSQAYDYLLTIDGDDVAALDAAKLWYDFPTVKAEDLPLPADWVKPSQRPKKPKPPATINHELGTVALIGQGEFEIDRQFALSMAAPNQKYFVTPKIAWGNYTWMFGETTGHRDYKEPLKALARLAEYLPETPRGVGLLLAGVVKRCHLADKEGWKNISTFADVLRSPDVRNKVSTQKREELGMVLSSGHCHEHGSPARFLAAHARENSALWQALSSLRPDSPLIAHAAHLAAGADLVSASTPIPTEVYNDALRVFGIWQDTVKATAQPCKSETLYRTFAQTLSYQFPNNLVEANVALAARVIAEVIQADEQHLPPTIDLA